MNWLRSLEEARSLEAVLEVVNEYLAQKPDDFWRWIPEQSRPIEISTEEELHQWHHRLVQEIARVKSPNVRLQDLTVFLLRASVRAHQLNLKREQKGPSNDREFSAAAGIGRRV